MEINNIKFSVLLSVYYKESPAYLYDALVSVFNNTLKPTQVVLVKDGKLTLELDQIIEKFICQYSDTLFVLPLLDNVGLGQALKIGLEYCKYDLVARMDTDDICCLSRFEKQVTFLINNPSISVLGGGIGEFSSSPEHIDCYRTPPETFESLKRYIKYRCPFNHMTVMFRKKDVLTSGSYQDFFLQEDYNLWIRMYLKGYKFANLSDILVLARAGNDMFKRRGGIKYLHSERKTMKFMYQNNILNIFEFSSLIVFKTIVRLCGSNVRGVFYKLFLRKNN